jgi:hypothetical protein
MEPEHALRILATGLERVEPGAQIQQTGYPTIGTNRAGCRLDGPRQNTEQRRLPRAIAPDQTKRVTGFQRKGNIVQGMEPAGL